MLSRETREKIREIKNPRTRLILMGSMGFLGLTGLFGLTGCGQPSDGSSGDSRNPTKAVRMELTQTQWQSQQCELQPAPAMKTQVAFEFTANEFIRRETFYQETDLHCERPLFEVVHTGSYRLTTLTNQYVARGLTLQVSEVSIANINRDGRAAQYLNSLPRCSNQRWVCNFKPPASTLYDLIKFDSTTLYLASDGFLDRMVTHQSQWLSQSFTFQYVYQKSYQQAQR